MSSIEPNFDVFLVEFLFDVSSLYRCNKSPTAVAYLVLPLKSSSPLICLGDPILDGFWKNDSAKLSNPSSLDPPPVKTNPALMLFEYPLSLISLCIASRISLTLAVII